MIKSTLSIIRHAWRREDRRRTAPPAPVELMNSIARTNIFPFFVHADSGWTHADIDRLLAQYGINIFGNYRFGKDLVFYVRVGQANFAQWLMERAGVPLKHRVLDGRVGKRRRKLSYRKKPPKQPPLNGAFEKLLAGFDSIVSDVESLLK